MICRTPILVKFAKRIVKKSLKLTISSTVQKKFKILNFRLSQRHIGEIWKCTYFYLFIIRASRKVIDWFLIIFDHWFRIRGLFFCNTNHFREIRDFTNFSKNMKKIQNFKIKIFFSKSNFQSFFNFLFLISS